MHARIGAVAPLPPPPPLFGEKGTLKVTRIGPRPAAPVVGDVTGFPYAFNRQATMFMDVRDAAFFLGPDYKEA